jgi:hypothetical protein
MAGTAEPHFGAGLGASARAGRFVEPGDVEVVPGPGARRVAA